MQPNILTLAVDTANTGSTTDQTYERYDEYQNRSIYVGSEHSNDARDTISLYRTFPTKSGNFKGTAKSSFKISEDQDIAGVDGVAVLTAPAIVEVNFSFPVGTTAAKILELRQRVLALLDTDTIMDDLNVKQMV
jgi:hypothetical protein